jgi:CrcB protein
LSAARASAKLARVVRFVLVCLGGAAGTGARYLFGVGAQRLTGGGFPYGTIGVNLIGSFLIVVVMQLGLMKETLSPDVRVILSTGVMGGFTTYSAFNYETVQFLRTGAVGLAALNVGVTLVGCLLAAGLGFLVAR